MAKPDVYIAEYLVLLGRNAAAAAEFHNDPDKAMKCFGLAKTQSDHIKNDTPDQLGQAIIAEFAQTIGASTQAAAGPAIASMTTKVV